MKKILFLSVALFAMLAMLSSCDDYKIVDEFKPFKLNIPENEVVKIAPEGGWFEVYALTTDKDGNVLDLFFPYDGSFNKWSYGDYTYYEYDTYKVTYNRAIRHAVVDVYANNTGEKRKITMRFCPCGPTYAGYETFVEQESL